MTSRQRILRGASAALVALGFAFGGLTLTTAAVAQQTGQAPMAKDNMGKDSMSKDSMAKDNMKKDTMKKDTMGKDTMGKDNMAKDSMKK